MSLKHVILLLAILLVSCNNGDVLPKPPAYLRLEYPEPDYKPTDFDLPFTFDYNTNAQNITAKSLRGTQDGYAVDVAYTKLKGTIYLTYKPINKKKELLKQYLKDAQNFTQEHTKKADEIKPTEYANTKSKVYGMFFNVTGDAASQAQFYVTDSTDHFLTGSLYFYTKPNYDSILPAAHYIQKDMKHILETLEWR